MKFNHRALALPALLALFFCSLPMIRAAVQLSDSHKAKARHYLNSALAESAKENAIIYSSLLRQASRLDSTDEYQRFIIGQEAGVPDVAVRMMRTYAEKHPTDRYVAMPFIGALVGNEEMEEAAMRMQMLVNAMPEDIEVRAMEMELWSLLDSVDRAEAVIDFMKEIGLDDETEYSFRMALLIRDEANIDTMKVVDLARRYYDAHSQDSLAFNNYVYTLSVAGKRDSALNLISDYIKTNPANPSGYMLRLSLEDYEGDSVAIRKTINELINLPSTDIAQLTNFFIEGDKESYADVVDTIASRFPDNISAQENIMIFNYIIGRHKLVDSFAASNTPRLTNPRAIFAAINSDLILDKAASALELYRHAKSIGIENENFEQILPPIYLYLNDEKNFKSYRDSVSMKMLEGISPIDTLIPFPYSSTLSGFDELKSIYSMESELYRRLGDADKALLAARNALTLNPNDAEALNNYAYFIALDTDDPDELAQAFSLASKAVDIDPEFNKFDTLAYILFKQGRVKEAIELQEKLINSLDSELESNAEFVNHLGDFYYAAGNSDKALDLWKKASDANPGDQLISRKIAERKYIPESLLMDK